jgi:hypothetical protein
VRNATTNPNKAMLLNQLLNPKASAYSAMIAEATGAHRIELPMIERIMREVIFHSTLDWQTKAQFDAGAIEAYQEYKALDGFYNAEHNFTFYRFHLSKTDTKLTEAVIKLDRATAKGVPGRIAKGQADVEKLREKKVILSEKVELYERIMQQMSRLYAGEPLNQLESV